MSNNKKKRKFQIEPNSISETEEANVKSVLNLFRNRGGNKDAAPVMPGSEDAPKNSDDRPEQHEHARIETSPSSLPPLRVVGTHDPGTVGAHQLETAGTHNTETKFNSEPTTPKDVGTHITEELGTHNITDGGTHSAETVGARQKKSGNPQSSGAGTKEPTTKKAVGSAEPKKVAVGTHAPPRRDYFKGYDRTRSTTSLHLRADTEILQRARHFIVDQADLFPTLKDLYDVAVAKFIDEFGNPQHENSENVGTGEPLDDRRLKMLFKSRPFIINLYLRYNSIFNELSTGGKTWSARWLPRDDESGHRYNEVPPAVLELGILQTQLQKGFGSSRIQTFKYYTDEIEKVLTSGVSDEMLTTILKYHRQLWKNQTGREVDLDFLNAED